MKSAKREMPPASKEARKKSDKGLRALLFQPSPEFSVKGPNVGMISMTQWEGLKINWLHAFFPRNCVCMHPTGTCSCVYET